MARTFNDLTLMKIVVMNEKNPRLLECGYVCMRGCFEIKKIKYIKVASFIESMEFLLDVMQENTKSSEEAIKFSDE